MTPHQNEIFFFRKIVKEKIVFNYIGSFLRKTHNFSWFELISREMFQISNLKQDEIASNLQKIAKICSKPLRLLKRGCHITN